MTKSQYHAGIEELNLIKNFKMKIKPSKIKLWSNIGTRASFGMAALELGATKKELIIISGDTSTSAGLERFKKNILKNTLMLELQNKI